MIFTKDNLKLGLVLGLLGPLAGLVVVYFIHLYMTANSLPLSVL
jgi:hypothetical protein